MGRLYALTHLTSSAVRPVSCMSSIGSMQQLCLEISSRRSSSVSHQLASGDAPRRLCKACATSASPRPLLLKLSVPDAFAASTMWSRELAVLDAAAKAWNGTPRFLACIVKACGVQMLPTPLATLHYRNACQETKLELCSQQCSFHMPPGNPALDTALHVLTGDQANDARQMPIECL